MSRGGKRIGAGRPKGQGRFGEPTKAMRVPESMLDDILNFIEQRGYSLPLYASTVSAGQALPADDMHERINLAQVITPKPKDTFLVNVTGDSMLNASIHDGDMLVVEKDRTARNGEIVVAGVDGQVTVKRLDLSQKMPVLQPENDDFDPIVIGEETQFSILGVVTKVIHDV